MRVLIIKTSSLGDIINTLPALTDAGNCFSDIQFDWVIENAFAEIPAFHHLVNHVIPIKLRHWRKHPLAAVKNQEWQMFYHHLRQEKYDFVIDAQGLIKSGFVTFLARGKRCGYDRHSAWEPLACLAYQQRFSVDKKQHAITRIRALFAQSLGYSLPETTPESGIDKNKLPVSSYQQKYCVFLHGTARDEKCWPEENWQGLIKLMQPLGYKILLPWGNEAEKARAERLAAGQPYVEVLPKSSLGALSSILAHSTANIAVDTGLGHLAAALDIPTVSLYGPTFPELNGTVGKHQIHIKKNAMADITVDMAFEAFYPCLIKQHQIMSS